MKYLIAFLLILGFSICGHSQKNKPKVVVGIVVDQMCYEYLYRFQDNYSKKGFKEIPVEKNCPYKRSNIKMELLLIDKN